MSGPMDTPSTPTEPKTKPKAGPIAVLVIAVLVVIGIANSGDKEPTDSSSSLPAAAAGPEAVPEVAEPEADLGADAAVSGDLGAGVAVVPDVVGLNHQLAQDILQAGGFYLLLEEDATGQGRALLYDRNWEVVSQSVPAGSSVSTATPIRLYAKKTGE